MPKLISALYSVGPRGWLKDGNRIHSEQIRINVSFTETSGAETFVLFCRIRNWKGTVLEALGMKSREKPV